MIDRQMTGSDHAAALRVATAEAPVLAFLERVRDRLPDAQWFLVGGAVRDVLLGRGMPADIDLVCRNVPMDRLADALSPLGRVDLVGRTFGVLKFVPDGHEGHAIDIALPRTELAMGTGAYRDFEVHADEELPIEDDLSRRDFTVNAMAWDLADGALTDRHGGLDDLEARRLRAVGAPEERFAEDLSRMLRCVRFACQLGFDIDAPTWDAVRAFASRINDAKEDPATGGSVRLVPHETVAKELVKALDADAVRAIDLFEDAGLLFRILPELAETTRTPQSPPHHTEGDVWTHIKLAVAALHDRARFGEWFPDERPDVQTTLCALLHDIGKPATRGEKDGRITFHGHDAVGADMARRIAERLRLSSVSGYDIDPDRMAWLVRLHLLPILVDLDEIRHVTLHRHFFEDPAWGRRLLHVAYADMSASVPDGGEPDLSNLRRLLDRLDELRRTMKGATDPVRLLSGKDVMDVAGVGPGPQVGAFLDDLKDAQLRGEVTTDEEAKAFIRRSAGA